MACCFLLFLLGWEQDCEQWGQKEIKCKEGKLVITMTQLTAVIHKSPAPGAQVSQLTHMMSGLAQYVSLPGAKPRWCPTPFWIQKPAESYFNTVSGTAVEAVGHTHLSSNRGEQEVLFRRNGHRAAAIGPHQPLPEAVASFWLMVGPAINNVLNIYIVGTDGSCCPNFLKGTRLGKAEYIPSKASWELEAEL